MGENIMTTWVDQLKENIPDYAKDTRLNIDAVITAVSRVLTQ